MTTVTDKEKRLLAARDRAVLAGGAGCLREDPELAERFARRLVELAHRLVPERSWTLEELREALEIASRQGPEAGARTMEGRVLRKRLVEQCSLAKQYGDGFGCLVITIAGDPHPDAVEGVLRAAASVLRRSDMVFPYRRRVFLVLPRLRQIAFPRLVERVQDAVEAGGDADAATGWAYRFFGGDGGVAAVDVLDWAEDQLRDFA